MIIRQSIFFALIFDFPICIMLRGYTIMTWMQVMTIGAFIFVGLFLFFIILFSMLETAKLSNDIDKNVIEMLRYQKRGSQSQYGFPTDDELETMGYLTDGFGNYWDKYCPKCGAEMVVVRPGDARCSKECYRKRPND